ncbi:MAG: hypothetical protein IPK07_01730 [Deltaproteobacteria bacterium]|nr:hypothetical protein [Deltaproteobacteria bacterium]
MTNHSAAKSTSVKRNRSRIFVWVGERAGESNASEAAATSPPLTTHWT